VTEVAGVIAALAAVGALFFAWRTVVEARAARAEDERARKLSRVENLSIALGDLAQQLDRGRRAEGRVTQARARVLWVTAEAGGEEVREAVVTPITAENCSALAEQARKGVENMLTGLEDFLAAEGEGGHG
jgi:hypothetical protein